LGFPKQDKKAELVGYVNENIEKIIVSKWAEAPGETGI
jgi:hypothetical protein